MGTSNRDKFAEIVEILRPDELGVELVFGGDLVDSPPPETGSDFLENATLKARFYSEASGLPAIADDSGLVVDALGGAPGVMSARYAGEGCSYEENNRKLLRKLSGVRGEDRRARFVCVAVLWMPDGKSFSTAGTLEGRIAESPRGSGGFGYDPIFELPDGRTVAQLSRAEKNRISHRAKAFVQMRGVLAVVAKMWKSLHTEGDGRKGEDEDGEADVSNSRS